MIKSAGTVERRSVRGTFALLDLYRSPGAAAATAIDAWPEILGAARRSRTLAHMGLRLAQLDPSDLPTPVRGHLEAVSLVVRFQTQRVSWELTELAESLKNTGGDAILLKGAAYIAAGLPMSTSRISRDVDLLVRRQSLAEVETSLLESGWDTKALDAHDDAYYRDWSHELPPFTHPDRGIEVDLHHAITPAMRGPGIDTEKLIAASIEVEFDGHRRFRVLQPVDQLIHCAIHTFKDSDLTLRLRETMDFDLLYRHYRELDADLDDKLVARAIELGIPRPLWWSIHFARRWLGSPIPERLLEALPAPSAATVRVMNWLCDRAMLPGPRMERTGLDRLAAIVLLARYHHQRLPLTKLIPHLLNKSSRRLMQPKEEPGGP